MQYRKEIDGLRALAVILVIFFHAGSSLFSGGFIGVDVFFVISGYLITTIIISEREKKAFSLARFYERRARRILPALFFVLFSCLPFAWLYLLPADRKAFSESLGAVAIFASNILFWNESGYFEPAAELKPLLHTWSLAVEEQYYLLFPILIGATWAAGKRWIVVILAVFALASFLLAMWASQGHPAFAFFLLPARGWEILAGALVAFYFDLFSPALWKPRTKQLASAIGLILIACSVLAFDRYMLYPSQYTLIPVTGAVLIILFATPDTLVGKMLSTRILVSLGLISYSAYLWHQPLFAFVRSAGDGRPSAALSFVLAICAFVLGYFSWKYVEIPFREKNNFSRNQVMAMGLSGGIFFIVIALSGSATNGFAMPSEEELTAYRNYSHKQFDRQGVCFMDINQTYKDFSDQCTIKSTGGTLIWGDSHAAALSYGFQQSLNDVTQYTASGCPPIKDMDVSWRPNCRAINDFVVKQIERIRPRQIYLHADWGLYNTGAEIQKLSQTIAYIRTLDSSIEITLIGSVPQWRPSLPGAMLRKKIAVSANTYLQVPIFSELTASDNALSALATAQHVRFFSALKALCKGDRCQTTTTLGASTMLITWDYGHLTAGGSILLARIILGLD